MSSAPLSGRSLALHFPQQVQEVPPGKRQQQRGKEQRGTSPSHVMSVFTQVSLFLSVSSADKLKPQV